MKATKTYVICVTVIVIAVAMAVLTYQKGEAERAAVYEAVVSSEVVQKLIAENGCTAVGLVDEAFIFSGGCKNSWFVESYAYEGQNLINFQVDVRYIEATGSWIIYDLKVY